MKSRMGVSFLFVLALLVPLHAQKGKKPPPVSRPATAVVRCATTDPADCPNTLTTPPVLPDAVRDDGLGAYAPPPAGTPSTTSGAWLDSINEASLSLLGETSRFVWLDLRNTLIPPACGTSCRKHFDTLSLNDVWIHTNTVDSSGNEVSDGLLSIPVGGSSQARLKMIFDTTNAAGQTTAWAIRYNPTAYPGSDYVSVTRPASNVWVIEATEFDRARLVSPGSRGHGAQDEGTYAMPFRIILTVP